MPSAPTAPCALPVPPSISWIARDCLTGAQKVVLGSLGYLGRGTVAADSAVAAVAITWLEASRFSSKFDRGDTFLHPRLGP
jgi:hypothetical protein